MKITLILGAIIVGIFGCNQDKKNTGSSDNNHEAVIVNDTIPQIRSSVEKKAVANYSETVPDKLNDWKFTVDAFETAETFKYLLKIQYKELQVSDTLNIPNFGIYPTIALKKGPKDLSCIVGFQDKEKVFKEYKMVEVVSGQLKIRSLKSYRRGLYQAKKQ